MVIYTPTLFSRKVQNKLQNPHGDSGERDMGKCIAAYPGKGGRGKGEGGYAKGL